LEEAKSALDRIANDGHRASNVIGAIRSIYQKQPAQRAPHDLNKIVADILQLLATELRRHEIVVSFKDKRQQLFVEVDKVQLQQVIMNIVMNAIEAMDQNSKGEHRLLISYETGLQDGVLMAIADNGPGFGPEGSEKIFEPLFTTKSKRMGMGLAICRSIIEAHSGKLTARSPTQGGAIFEIWLPNVNH
jgi:C4-dicarboxylate-specific signal transduction histidine kinase